MCRRQLRFVVVLPFDAVSGWRSETGASGQMPESSPPVVRKSIHQPREEVYWVIITCGWRPSWSPDFNKEEANEKCLEYILV